MTLLKITPHAGLVRISWRDHTIVSTTKALDLRKGSSPAVLYVPREDADLRFFAKTERSTHCPHKGDAAYYTLQDGEARAENAVWTYETPFDAALPIKDHLAFYPSQVDIQHGG